MDLLGTWGKRTQDLLGRARTSLLGDDLPPAEKRAATVGTFGPGIAAQMQGLDTAQRTAVKRGGVRDLLGDPDVQARATDVAANLDFTGTFGGVKAKTADLGALAKAEELAKAGTDPADIWQQTGWFRGVDDKWRHEIDDSKAKVLDTPASWDARVNASLDAKNVPVATAAPLEDVFSHPELARAYFPTREAAPEVLYDKLGEGRGNYRGKLSEGGTVTLDSGVALDPKAERSIMLHELQHGVQEREGFAKGGSPAMFEADYSLARHAANEATAAWQARSRVKYEGKSLVEATEAIADQQGLDPERLRRLIHDYPDEELTDFITSLVKRKQAIEPHAKYRRLAGETEARAVQARRDLLPEQRRARPPWLDYDVPPEQQIVRRR